MKVILVALDLVVVEGIPDHKVSPVVLDILAVLVIQVVLALVVVVGLLAVPASLDHGDLLVARGTMVQLVLRVVLDM